MAVVGQEGCQCVYDGGLELFGCTGSSLAQVCFEFGEGHFDWVEVWAVGWQVLHARSAGFDQRFDRGDFVGGEVVQDYNVAGVQFRAEHVLQICTEDLGIDCAFDQKGCDHAIAAQGADHRGTAPVSVRHVRDQALVLLAASVQPSHLRVQSGLVDEDQSFTVQSGLFLTPVFPRGLHVGPFLLGGVQRFFYSSIPSVPAAAIGPCGRSRL